MKQTFLAPTKSLTEKMRWESLCDAFCGEYSIFLCQRVASYKLACLSGMIVLTSLFGVL